MVILRMQAKHSVLLFNHAENLVYCRTRVGEIAMMYCRFGHYIALKA
jgi:hypothetical protein